MKVCVNAWWLNDWRDFGSTVALYEIPDDTGRYEADYLALFGRIARDFAEQTDDEAALEQIEYGFDWGVFIEYVPDEFLARYGVKRLDAPDAYLLGVEYDECVMDYKAEEEA